MPLPSKYRNISFEGNALSCIVANTQPRRGILQFLGTAIISFHNPRDIDVSSIQTLCVVVVVVFFFHHFFPLSMKSDWNVITGVKRVLSHTQHKDGLYCSTENSFLLGFESSFCAPLRFLFITMIRCFVHLFYLETNRLHDKNEIGNTLTHSCSFEWK